MRDGGKGQYRLDIDIAECMDKGAHFLGGVVNAVEQDCLVSHGHTGLV